MPDLRSRRTLEIALFDHVIHFKNVMFSITKLRHLIAVDRAGSITAAAKSLNITQSSVTKSVAEIEREIGYLIFDRKSRGVVATDDGREFISRAARIVSDMEMLISDAQAGSHAREAVFRIGVCPPSIEGLLNRALKEMIRKNPELCIHLVSTPVERGLKILRRGDIDVLVGPEEFIEREPDFSTEPLGSLHAVLFGRKKHPLFQKRKITQRDLTEYSIITPDLVSIYADSLRDLYERVGENPERRLYVVESFPMVADIVGATDLLATVGRAYAETSAFRSRFTQLDIDIFEPMALCCGYRSTRLPNRSIRSFLAALADYSPV